MSKRAAKRARAIAVFGGTFDPIHCGHLVVAGAAARRFQLDEVYFVPSSWPPHKKRQELAAFAHRYAMVALACADKPRFVPSLAEAPDEADAPQVFYSVDTVRRFREQHPNDKIYFILGADSFLEIPIWWSYEALLDSCDFIVASRPGIRLEALQRVIPPRLLSGQKGRGRNAIALRKSTVHLLTSVASNVSSTDIRRRCERRTSIHALVPPAVEDYILRQALYR
ncbi:MAG: nicotinate-nucleotide adenylyltransferase [Candidatus Acidiferrales bacterium]